RGIAWRDRAPRVGCHPQGAGGHELERHAGGDRPRARPHQSASQDAQVRHRAPMTLRAPRRCSSPALALCALLAGAIPARADEAPTPYPESLVFAPPENHAEGSSPLLHADQEDALPHAPFGEHLLTDVESWRRREGERGRAYVIADYNRVDR